VVPGTVRAMTTDDAVRHPDRLVQLEAVHNFRDLGGYPTEDGRETRWRQVYRADGLNRLSVADVAVMRELGLRTVIDLRTEQERRDRGWFPVGGHPVDYHHLSVIDRTWNEDDQLPELPDHPVEFLLPAYRAMLAEGGTRLVRGLELLAAPGALPAVFHCAAGKDRTGLLAAFLLSGLGVSDHFVAADYALSEEAVQRTLAWAQQAMPELVERYRQIPDIFHAAHPDAMHGLLQEIRDQHGSVRAYTETLGLDPTVWFRLEAALLDVAG
jgi:protein-tyrosine phosphatase